MINGRYQKTTCSPKICLLRRARVISLVTVKVRIYLLLTGYFWQISELPIVIDSDGELDNESDLHHRGFKIGRRFFFSDFKFKLTSNYGWLSIQVKGRGREKMANSDGTKHNIQVITQSTVIRSDSLSRHPLSSSLGESVISSRSAARLQSLEISSTHWCHGILRWLPTSGSDIFSNWDLKSVSDRKCRWLNTATEIINPMIKNSLRRLSWATLLRCAILEGPACLIDSDKLDSLSKLTSSYSWKWRCVIGSLTKWWWKYESNAIVGSTSLNL